MFQWIPKTYRWAKKKSRNFKFHYYGHDDALQRVFEISRIDMSSRDVEPSELEFNTDTFEKLIKACGIEIKNKWPRDGWELHFKGKCTRIRGPQGSRVIITTIRDVKNFLVEAGVKEPAMIYDYLPGA